MPFSDYQMSVASKPANYRRLDRLLRQLRTDPGLRILRHAKAHLWTDWLNEAVDNGSAIDFLEEFILRYASDNELITSDLGASDLPEDPHAAPVSQPGNDSAGPTITSSLDTQAEWGNQLPVFAVELKNEVPPLTLHAPVPHQAEPLVGMRVLVIGGPETLIAEEEAILSSLGAAVVSVRAFSEAIGRMLRAPADVMLINQPTVDGWNSQKMAVWLEKNRPDWLARMLFTNSAVHAGAEPQVAATRARCMLRPFSSTELLECLASMGLIPYPQNGGPQPWAVTPAGRA
jgi:hypothetical protein